ncbi:immunoglobulin-like domain-containing protein [Geosporobacter ferrireducens]|uniref:Atrophied bacterial Ig domain-containing protein n=1 Tax=Geosporobacter ferrireducens TaxID=1424294 RepID=A0A1D8GB90_9FIRM|nr:immunoglobulin-like domain-containing protein [Geosporobacter ferrireducens]AOT68179.1 hypothetical protein Gferi_00420 [Geosporobacter ferrireducens]MTI54229.1 prepilin-type N-terminal cleavage/methylation domain-containing protein [Geosporobacter ferrireducens]
MKRPLNNSRGITLIELLITLAIISIVTLVISSFQIFGIRTFNIGQSQTRVQHNIRMTADYITKEMRYAYTVEFFDALPTPLEDGKRYFVVEGNTIKYYIDNVVAPLDVLNETSVDFSPILKFEKKSNKTLNFAIEGTYKGQDYNISSDVTSLNLISNIPDGDGSVVAFSSPISDKEAVYIDWSLVNLNNVFVEVIGNYYRYSQSASLILGYTNTTSPKCGSTVTWTSSDPSLIGHNGYIQQPADPADPPLTGTATLTAKIRKNDSTRYKTFVVEVIP